MRDNTLIGKRIRNARLALDLTAEELASKVGKTQTTILRYETGAIEKVPALFISEIANVLNVSPAYLMGWDKDKDIQSVSPEECIRYFPDLLKNSDESGSFLTLPLDFFPQPTDYVAVTVIDKNLEPVLNRDDIAIFRKTITATNGSVILFTLNGVYRIMRYYKMPNMNCILLDNTNIPISITPNDEFKIVGVLTKRITSA